MATEIAYSVNGVPIRLTDERWGHIEENHPELIGYHDDCLNVLESPDMVLSGRRGSLMAVRGYGRRRYLYGVYRETSPDDGFVITAYFKPTLDRRKVVWRP